jgi:hypothetical protein
MHTKLLRIVDFDETDQLLIRYSFCIRQILEKRWEYKGIVHHLYTDSEKAYDSIRRGISYNIVIEFGTPTKLVRIIKVTLNETYSKVHIGKNLSNAFPIQNVLKKRDDLMSSRFNFASEYAIRKVQENQ